MSRFNISITRSSDEDISHSSYNSLNSVGSINSITYDTYDGIHDLLNVIIDNLLKHHEENITKQDIDNIVENQHNLISFDKSIERYLSLFDDINTLKQSIMINTIKNNKIVFNGEYPLIITYIYYKYTNSLLLSKPSDALIISFDEFKQTINQSVFQTASSISG